MLSQEKQKKLSEQAKSEHEENVKREESEKQLKEKKKHKRIILALSILFLVLLVIGVPTYLYKTKPGRFDDFAKCLTEKGAVMYGAIEWCHYTQAQANMFGKSRKYVDYRDYRELDGIRKTPTWVIDEKWYEGVQSFERLSALTDCKFS